MRDPHTRESRGFGFVNMMTGQQADAAKEGLQGEQIDGRTLSIEKARRSKPRTPTPGKYFGPPKRGIYFSLRRCVGFIDWSTEDFRGPPRGGRYGDRYDDRRGGYGRRDDSYGGGYRSSRYGDRGDERGYGRRDDYGPRTDRYASGRDDRYGGGRGGDSRGGRDYYDRDSGRAPPAAGYADAPAGGKEYGRSYEDRGEDRYARR